MSMLILHEIIKSYGTLKAVDHVSLEVDPGENLAIVGESGSGKSTLAKIILGLIKPDSGYIHLERSAAQMVFQDPYQSLDPLWNVRQILNEALWRQPPLTPAQRQARIEQMLVAVGLLPQMLNRFPHEFSGGERQRIAIARALLAQPKLLILDEAVSALDTLVQKQIIELLGRIKKEFNLTYVFISHNLRLARNFSDKIAVMRQGKIVETGPIKDIMQAPKHSYTQQLLDASFYTGL